MYMNRQRTWQEYRTIDLAILGAILAVCEFLTVKAANIWFPAQPYTVSLAAAVTSIVYMRWGWWGALHAVLSGFVFCATVDAELRSYLIYCLGNLLSVLAVPVLLKIGKEKVRTGSLALVFPAAVLLLMQAGRALVALATGAPARSCVGFFTTDSISMLFTIVVIWIARRLDGVYEDQKHYLLRLSEKENAEKEGH